MVITRFFAKIFIIPYLMRDAALAFKDDKFRQAITIYLKIMQLHPNYYDAHLWAGTAYSAIDLDNEAVECFKNAIRINKKGYDAYSNYAHSELKLNRYEHSLILINKAIEHTPFTPGDFSRLYYRKGLLEYYLFQYQEALSSFNKSLEYEPTNSDAENGRTIAAEGILSEHPFATTI
jgi:tetratricopeptide (TPR) repeat protein